MSKITGYIKDSYRELVEKVSWPTWEELQSSVIVGDVFANNHYRPGHLPDGPWLRRDHEPVL